MLLSSVANCVIARFVGVISRKTSSTLTIAYYGWNNQFDEDLSVQSERIHPYQTYTSNSEVRCSGFIDRVDGEL